ncbi:MULTISPECIES: hypothetical protein [unclassified Nocardioides]|uniref:hypothetical protein n=1 Tax=unclassified Nocardioides TaxID=2615069 RepID=UPI0006F87174|nr:MULTISPECIES: hypothetical protein [unclassified Nocardioides]KRA28059.1 hypothetical protein ASD81_23100 [Nocardioides sp. Root614]KRA86034.1 hypothetical protein ASD84_23340 [Nocardioides sp. Root682]
MTVTIPSDPFDLPLPPLVVGRYRSPDGRAEVALRSNVWVGGAWWSCLDRTFRAAERPAHPPRTTTAACSGVEVEFRALPRLA